ncbi:MAG: transglycosylase family protein [Actinobacteria bacterium]|nr:transglycosylase family protein [Actinomycetota bacterium]
MRAAVVVKWQEEAAAAAAAAPPVSAEVAAWASSPKSMDVKMCESTNNYAINTGNGYYGAWQFDYPSWHANGGGAYAEYPHLAPDWAQDQVAYNYYQVAGWGPWECG